MGVTVVSGDKSVIQCPDQLGSDFTDSIVNIEGIRKEKQGSRLGEGEGGVSWVLGSGCCGCNPCGSSRQKGEKKERS